MLHSVAKWEQEHVDMDVVVGAGSGCAADKVAASSIYLNSHLCLL